MQPDMCKPRDRKSTCICLSFGWTREAGSIEHKVLSHGLMSTTEEHRVNFDGFEQMMVLHLLLL